MIKSKWEDISPKRAAEYLKKNVTNRGLREVTVQAYERDMKAGNWVPTHQGIAFNDREELIDGQHRLKAVIRANVIVKMLVTRGIPALSGETHTMDAVDRGAARSLADQLRLQHGFNNPNLAAASATAITNMSLAGGVRRVSVPQILKVLDIYGRHIAEVGGLFDKSMEKRLRRSQLVAALSFARAVEPHQVDKFVAGLISGAGLTEDSPLLALRNFLFSDACVHWTSSGLRKERTAMAFLVLNSVRQYVAGEKSTKVSEGRAGFVYFASRQKDNLAKVAGIFFAEAASLSLEVKDAKVSSKGASISPPAAAIAPRIVRSAADVKLTPLAESLIRGKDMSERVKRKVAIG